RARLVKGVDVLRLPEVALEAIVVAADAPHHQPLADDDRPGPDAGREQAEHHHLHDDVGLHEQADRRHRSAYQRDFGHETPSPFNRANRSTQSRGWRFGRPSGERKAAVTRASARISSPRMTR